MYKSMFAIAIGAALGALFRWLLSSKLNALLPLLPLGTLIANLVGAYIIGVGMGYFAVHASPELQLFLLPGFCGGLTTFSTFSAEVITQLQSGRFSWAVLTIMAHLVGSLLMTLLGLLTYQVIKT